MPKKTPDFKSPDFKLDKEDLIEALKDSKVLETLTAHLSSTMSAMIETSIKTHLTTFGKEIRESIEMSLRDAMEDRLKPCEEKISNLISENKALSSRLEQLETYSKAENLIFHGLPEITREGGGGMEGDFSEATCDLIVNVCNERLGTEITKLDISAVVETPQWKE